MLLFDFSKPDTAPLFHPIGDRVMGGVSAGAMEAAKGFAVFAGEVSLENQGGFASVRSQEGLWDLSAFTGIQLEVRGDGRTYKLSLTTDPRPGSVVYRARFTPEEEAWSRVRIPFADLKPTFRGEAVPDAPPLDPARVATFGFLISDRQEGGFRLEIKSIAVY